MEPRPAAGHGPTARLTVFAFLWACQALVHHEFYSQWLQVNDWAGWLVAGLALAVLLRPGSLPLFAAMLAASVIYNLRKWPFVVNHILMESLINLAILGILGWFAVRRPGGARLADAAGREAFFDRFAPVGRAMLIVMYYFAVLAKLNSAFVDVHASCVAVMYKDLLRRAPFLFDTAWAKHIAIYSTVAIEIAIPLLFTFRRTRPYTLLIGLPFHFMLGSIGHRTFSAIAYALYGLFVIDDLTRLVEAKRAWLERRFGPVRMRRATNLLRAAVVAGVAGLIGAAKTGNYHTRIGPVAPYQIPWLVWGVWSAGIMVAYFAALARFRSRPAGTGPPTVHWINAMTLLMLLNGMSQYVGLKTETGFTMYSNLRTEAGLPNHFFMRLPHLAGYQEDLVDILATDHPELQRYIDRNQWITFFEFQRFTSTASGDFWVRYRRKDGEPALFTKQGGAGNDTALMRKHGLVAAKLLYFRPVSKAACMPCQH